MNAHRVIFGILGACPLPPWPLQICLFAESHHSALIVRVLSGRGRKPRKLSYPVMHLPVHSTVGGHRPHLTDEPAFSELPPNPRHFTRVLHLGRHSLVSGRLTSDGQISNKISFHQNEIFRRYPPNETGCL